MLEQRKYSEAFSIVEKATAQLQPLYKPNVQGISFPTFIALFGTEIIVSTHEFKEKRDQLVDKIKFYEGLVKKIDRKSTLIFSQQVKEATLKAGIKIHGFKKFFNENQMPLMPKNIADATLEALKLIDL